MAASPHTNGHSKPLTGIRVLDLATGYCEITGRLLADVGAEVIKIEPPGGHPSRRMPPFVDSPRGRARRLTPLGRIRHRQTQHRP